ncbi:MAG: hypothetical protein FWG04_04735 [Desulfovibrionaceae bacterium]|nr:hypothetical protein [Desulfovibrionaceae bacterium]
MSREWSRTLEEWPDALFESALLRHRQRSSYWPTEADVIRAAEEIREEERVRLRRAAQARPHDEAFDQDSGPLTPEERDRITVQVRRILDSIARRVKAGP